MPFAFSYPLWLLLLPALYLYFWYLSRITVTDLGVTRRRISLFTRCILVTILIFALADMRFQKQVRSISTVFVADCSQSISPNERNQEEQYIQHAVASMRSGDKVSLITFAQDPQIESMPANSLPSSILNYQGLSSETNISRALSQASALLQPEHNVKQIVLLSDGNENRGNALEKLAALNSDDIHLDTVTLPDNLTREALIDRMEMPSHVKIGQPFEIRTVVSSLTNQKATLTLSRNGSPVGSLIRVQLHSGKNLVSFQQTIRKPGAYRYVTDLQAPQDTYPENNRGEGYVWVDGKPTVLYVADSPVLTAFLRKTLASQHLNVEYASPSSLPTTPAALQGFDSIFLSNVSATELSQSQMVALQSACRDFGIGLGMVGGDNSFGAGYYRGTPIEEALPVSMDVKQQKKLPSVAVALVIEDLEIPSAVNMSIEAAKAVVDLLEPMDQVGVLDCNGAYTFSGQSGSAPAGSWRIPMQHVTDPQTIKNKMQTLTEMGDPPTYDPYLLEAARTLNNTDAKIKHIIFLGDGDAIYEQNQNALGADIRKITSMGITVSTIASGADGQGQEFMALIAQYGNGKAFVCDNESELPRLLLKDAETVSQPPIVEEPFIPTPMPSDPVLKGIDWSTAPPLLGYDVVTPKPTATVSLIDASPDRDNPIFASWQYGLGRSVAFMSDDRAKWAAQWLDWPGYSKFWAQTIRWTLRPYGPDHYDTRVTLHNGKGHIVVDAVDPNGHYVNDLSIKARVVPPTISEIGGAGSYDVALREVAPGEYENWFDAPDRGTYLVNVLEKKQLQGAVVHTMLTGVSEAYPPEYRALHADRILMGQLALSGMGLVDPPATDIFGGVRKGVEATRPLSEWLLVIAMLLLPFDIAIRRLAIDYSDLRRYFIKSRQLSSSRAASTPELERLQQRKRAANSSKTSPTFYQADQTPVHTDAKDINGRSTSDSKLPKDEEAEYEQSSMERLRAAKERARREQERDQE